MKKYTILLLSLLLMPSIVLADGIVIPPHDPHLPLDENSQLVAINYQNGLEKMIISVNFDMKNYNEAVWIFPVPSDPNRVVIDIIDEFPRFYGTNVISEARRSVDDVIQETSYTQIYPIFFVPVYIGGRLAAPYPETAKGALGGTIEGVTVYEHIEKGGISTDIVTSKTAEALYDFLQMKGINAPRGSLPVFDHYIGLDYTFVVSYISSPEQRYQYGYPYRRQPGIFITFPTDKIYYPLIPTSVYGSKTIPVRIYVIGHVTPELYDEIYPYSRADYYVQRYMSVGNLVNFFGNMNMERVKYTKVELSVPSKYFTQDLWFREGAPRKVNYAMSLYNVFSHELTMFILMTLLISAITGGITGLIIFRDFKKYAILGLSNIFSIIGLAIAVAFVKTKKVDEAFKKKLRKEGLIVITADRRKFLFVFLFSILFLIVGYIVGYLLKIPMT